MEKVYNSEEKKELRRKLRKESTPEERLLWKYLVGKKIGGYKFHRQYGIGRYIVDFYCPDKKIVVEIDGSQHYTVEGKEYDEIREEFMKTLGIRTLRFNNSDVKKNIKLVVKRIEGEAFRR